MATVTEARDFIGEADQLITDATAILMKKDASAEEKAKVPQMMEDAKALKAQAIQLDELNQLAGEIKSHVPTNPATGRPTAGGNFKSWGDFLIAVQTWAGNMRVDSRLKRFVDMNEPHEQKDMSEATGASGGFLVPTEFQAELLSIQAETAIVRPRATKIPMRRRQIQIPVLSQTATTAGIPHWFGGLRAYWTEEAAQKTASDPVFRQMVLTAWKLTMLTRSSDELLDDSAISLSAFLSGPMGMAGAIAWTEDFTFLQGDGAGKPLGILNSGATLTGSRGGSNNITYEDLTGMMRRFLPTGKGVWVISQSAMAELLDLNGPSGNPSYIWGSAVSGAPNTLLGLPVLWTEKLPALGTKGDVLLADFQYYVIGDRQATTIESTKFEKWEFDQTSWRAVHRVDGQPWLSAPLTYQDGTTAVSPFVALAA